MWFNLNSVGHDLIHFHCLFYCSLLQVTGHFICHSTVKLLYNNNSIWDIPLHKQKVFRKASQLFPQLLINLMERLCERETQLICISTAFFSKETEL